MVLRVSPSKEDFWVLFGEGRSPSALVVFVSGFVWLICPQTSRAYYLLSYYLFFNYLSILVFRRKKMASVLVFRRKNTNFCLGV